MRLLDWLGGVGAQINPFDNGETYDSYMKKRQQPQQQTRPQAPRQTPRPPQVGVNAVRPLSTQQSLPKVSQAQISQKSVANQFNPLKTVGDVAGGIGKGINDVATAVGGFVLPGTAKLTNQTLGIVENTGANIAGETQKLFGDKKGGQNTIDSVKRHVDQNLLAQGKGLFGQGGIYNSTDSLHNANPTEVLRKAGGTGLEVAGELLPVARVAKGPTLGAKIANNAIAGAVGNTLADVGSQYVQNGTVNPWQTAQSAAIGGAFGGAIPVVGAAVKPVGTKLVQTGQRAQNFGLLPPTKLTPEELFAAKKMRQAQAGVIDPHTVTEIDAILNMRAENKLGQQVGTPQAWQEVNKALDAHRAFDVEVNNRRMAAQEALQNANQFTRERLIPGGTIDPQWSKKRTNLQNNLAKALDTGTEQPVNFGKMSKKQFDETNKIFNEQSIPQLESRDLMVHPNVVKKLQEKRITTEGMTPEQIADVAYSAIHNKRSKVSDATNKSQSVRFATNKKDANLTNNAFVGSHGNVGSVKSVYPSRTVVSDTPPKQGVRSASSDKIGATDMQLAGSGSDAATTNTVAKNKQNVNYAQRTVTAKTVDTERLKTDPTYQKQVQDSIFASGKPTDNELLKIYRKTVPPQKAVDNSSIDKRLVEAAKRERVVDFDPATNEDALKMFNVVNDDILKQIKSAKSYDDFVKQATKGLDPSSVNARMASIDRMAQSRIGMSVKDIYEMVSGRSGKAMSIDPTANKQNVNSYAKANKELRTAIDSRIHETNPELFNTDSASRSFNESGTDTIPRIHVDDLKRYFGNTEGIPNTYKRTTGRADIDQLARDAGFDDIDAFVESIQQELDTRGKARENKDLLTQLRNDPTIIDDAQKALADDKARYGSQDTYQPSERDMREYEKMTRPQVESTTTRVARALDPNDKLHYKNLTPIEKKLYQGEKAKQKVAQAEVQKTKAKESLRETKIQKLLDERQRAIFAGQDDHVAAYDQELRKLGHDVSTDASPTATVSRDNAPQEPQPQGRQDNRTTQENVNRSSQRSARQAPSTDKKARTDRTYTDDNPDIDTEQYVKDMTDAQKAAQKGEKGYSKFKSDAKEKFIDDLSPIEDRLRKAINDGAQVDPKDHITYQLDRSRRSEGVMNAYVRDNGLDKIIQNVPDPNEFDQYLIARHAKELDPEIRTGRNAKADQALVKALNGKYDDYAKKLYAYNQKLLDTSVDYGLISKESAASLKKQYPDYVPFNRIFNEDELANLYGGNGKGDASLSSQGVVKSIKGSNRAIASPLNSIIDKTRVVIEQGERNRAAKILADYRQLPGNPFNLKEIPKGEAIGGRPTISFLDRGVKRTFETDKTIADAAKNMTRQDIGLWGRIAAVPARVLRGGATTVNIGFAGANVVKDVIGAAINSRHPFRIADPQALGKALAAALNHNGRYYQELMREGVAGTSFDMYRNPLKSNVSEIRSQKNIGTRALHNLRPDRWYRTLENSIGRSEDFGRALQYYSNKKGFEGKYGSGSKQAKILAADQARNNSTNFFRHGSYGKGINLAIPYWNAGVQGARIQTRRIVERPVQTIAKIGFTVAAPSAMIAANNYSTEKNRQVMEDIPQYEKDGNIIIVGPDAKLNKDTGRWEGVFKIPVPPQHMGIHKTIQDAVRAGFTGKPMDFLADAGAVTQNYTTINPVDAKATASSYVPQALKLVAEPMTNTNFFTGNKIVPDSQKNLPAADQYNEYTSGTARVLGKISNVSPRQIDNAIKTGMGGAGQNLVQFLDAGLSATGLIDKSEVKGQNVLDSVTRRFYGAASINPSDKADEAFSEYKNKITQTDAYKNASQYDKSRMLNRLQSDLSDVSWYVSGQSDKDTKLTQKQQSLLVNGFNPDNYTNLTSSGGVSINNKLSSDSKTTLDKYNSLSDDDRTKWFSTENDAEYKYNLAKFENDKLNGKVTSAQEITKKRSLYKDKIGSNYSKDVRDLYNVNENDLAQWLSEDDGKTDKKKLADDLHAYDRALYDAGVIKSMKYKGGIGAKGRSGSGRKRSGSKKSSGTTAGKSLVSLTSQMNKVGVPKTDTEAKLPTSKKAVAKKAALKKYTVAKASVSKDTKIKTSKA